MRGSPFGGGKHTRGSTFAAFVLGLVLTLVTAGVAVADDEPEAPAGGEEAVATVDLILTLQPGLTSEQIADAIARHGGTEVSSISVLRLHVVSVPAEAADAAIAAYSADADVETVDVDRSREAQGVPSDPSYPDQWALPQIGWDQAFGTIEPAGSAIIAVLDTGVNGDDLALVPGWSAFEGNTSDSNGHGTSVASIAAATTNNETGIAGVAYAGVSVMPVKVLDDEGIGQDSDIIAGLVWAVDNGADVALMAFSNPGYSAALQAAVDYAWDNGVVVVAATGNDASTVATYPAGTGKVMGVAATDAADALWSGSNSGAAAFISAPGDDILAGNGSMTGTSASAAIVAGAAALMRANDPSASNGVIVSRLAANADEGGAGNGRVNLARALEDTSTDAIVPVGAPGGGPVVGPYVAAARNWDLTLAGTGGGSVVATPSTGTILAATSCGGTGTATNSQTITSSCTSVTTSVNGATITFSATPNAASTFGGWSGQQNLTGTCSSAPSATPCAAVFSGNGKLTVTFNAKLNQTITFGPLAAKTYGDAPFTVSASASSGLPVSFSAAGNCTSGGTNGADIAITGAGSCTVTASQAGNATYNAAPNVNQTFAISQKTVSPAITADDKVYDGGALATILTRTLSGVVSSDDVSLTGGTATFADKNVGVGKTVTATGLSLSGSRAANYVLSSTSAATTASITALDVEVSFEAANKTYDGTTAADITSCSVSGVIGLDSVSCDYGSATAAFDTANVGTGKAVTGSGFALSGADAGNYAIGTVNETTADIGVKGVTAQFTAGDKTYDGTTAASITGCSLTGVFGFEDVSCDDSGASASFDDKNVGNGKAVTGSGFALAGADAGNYVIDGVDDTTADIYAKSLTVDFGAGDKTYDGTTVASVAGCSLTGVLGLDDVSCDDSLATASFADKNVGVNKTVTGSGFVLSGADSGNYEIATVNGATASIGVKGVTVQLTVDNKTYDGTTTATITGCSLTGVVGFEDVSCDDSGASASFDDKNVGNGKAVTRSGFALAGADAGNYVIDGVDDTTADITPKALTGAVTADDKVYDGDATATILTRTLSGVEPGDVVSYVGGVASFDDKNVGIGKTVTATGLSLSGADAGNYTVDATAFTTADITPKALTGAVTADDKVYDGDATATILTRTLSGVESGDVVSYVGGVASFDDKNVGIGKTVTATGLSLSGADAGNYTVDATAFTTADITPRALLVSATGVNKVYDGTTDATVTLSDDRVSGDDLTASYTAAAFGNKNVGTGKVVSVSGIAISGPDAGNYSANVAALTSANITARALTVTATGVNKVYDGTTDATVTLSDDRLAGDDLTTSYTAAAFNNKNVGTGKPVSVSGISISGTDAGNYSYSTTAMTSANITARALTVSAAGVNKVYDGTTAATVTLSDDRVAGDTLTTSYGSASFNDKNVGDGKPVSVTGITIGGADAGNYTFNTTAATTADITPRGLTVTATGVNKVYDGTTAAMVTLSDNRVAGDALITSHGGASFADPNVGTGKPVSVTGIAISGADAGNYTANTTAATTADISQKALTATAYNQAKQYSDPLPTFTYTYSGFVTGEGASDVDTPPTCGTTATAMSGPGAYPITCSGGADDNYSFVYGNGTLTVIQENAVADYTGPDMAFTSSTSSGTVTIPLRATLRDITAAIGDPAWDGYPGNISNATVQFVNRDAGNAVLCTATVGLIASTDPKVGTASCNWTPTIGSADSVSYTVGIVVGGWYVRNATADDTVVTVSKPLSNFITGGGHVVMNGTSAGTYAATDKTKMNFGFNVKYNKKGTNLQGNVNIIVRQDGRVYQIKANAMDTLAITPATSTAPGKATFTSKANLTDVTDPANPVSMGGNLALTMKITDYGEPGSSDTISVELFNSNGTLLFSSSWNGITSVERVLNGGNVSVK